MSLYGQRGVSAQKEDVHAAIRQLDTGLFPKAFCRIYPDHLGGSDEFVNVMHSDGAGTKSIIAYLYWKETGDASVWKGIAQDAIVMNLDDLLCTGIYDQLAFTSTIDRNKHLIPGEVLEQVIGGSQDFFRWIAQYGVHIHFLGGETADLGDVVRTISVNGTMAARWKRNKLITNEGIVAGDVIVGFASDGQATYEKEYNSGIGSNGLTAARHDMLHKDYASKYPESVDPILEETIRYTGPYHVQETIAVNYMQSTNIGRLLLSPTRTYAPVLKELLERHFSKVHGLVHCSGGGQTKCLKYIPSNTRVIKDNLFDPPLVFQLIRRASKSTLREMYEVFNMGCRLEVYTSADHAEAVIRTAEKFGIEAQVIGRVEEADEKQLVIHSEEGALTYS